MLERLLGLVHRLAGLLQRLLRWSAGSCDASSFNFCCFWATLSSASCIGLLAGLAGLLVLLVLGLLRLLGQLTLFLGQMMAAFRVASAGVPRPHGFPAF